MRTNISPFTNRQRGAAAVELALMTLPLVLMALAAVEFARIVYQYDVIVKATRDGVRILTGFDPDVTAEYPVALVRQRVAYSSYDANTQQGVLRLSGLTTGLVQICDRNNSGACSGSFANVSTDGSGGQPINLVRVQVSGYQFQPLFGAGIVPTITFGPIGTTMMAVD